MMKKVLLLFMVMLNALGAHAEWHTDIEFEVPEGFKVDTVSPSRFIFEKDSALAILDFISIPNFDKKKANAAPDSIFLNVGKMKPVETGMKGSADVINKYYDEANQQYVKVYRHHHGDGIAYLFAVNEVDDFAWSDSIDDSYHKGLRWYMIALLAIGAIILYISAMVMANSFLVNWPKFIVSALLCIIFTVTIGLLWDWEIALIVLALFLMIGIAARFGYTIIPI